MKSVLPNDLDKMSKEDLIAFLQGGQENKVETWNKWRFDNFHDPIDLDGATIGRSPTLDLGGIDFGKVNLNDVFFNYVDLSYASLSTASLENVTFRRTHLTNASLTHANMRGAHFSETLTIGADMTFADLRGAYPDGFNGCDLRWADMREINFAAPTIHQSLYNLRLFGARFDGSIGLRYAMFLGFQAKSSTIQEETGGEFGNAKEVYKTLKGYFESVGDYEGANWAYQRECTMGKFMLIPWQMSWLYSETRPKSNLRLKGDISWHGWLGLEIGEKVAGYGMSLLRPLVWLAIVIFTFGMIYWAGGMITAIPGCGYNEAIVQSLSGCAPTHNLMDSLLFSFGAMASTEINGYRPYLSHVGILKTTEILIGIALTGLFGFVLGNKLRHS